MIAQRPCINFDSVPDILYINIVLGKNEQGEKCWCSSSFIWLLSFVLSGARLITHRNGIKGLEL